MSIERKKIDDLAMQAGGYFSLPSEDSIPQRALFRRGSDPCHLGKATGG